LTPYAKRAQVKEEVWVEPISRFFSEMMQDRPILTMEDEFGNRTQTFEWYQFE